MDSYDRKLMASDIRIIKRVELMRREVARLLSGSPASAAVLERIDECHRDMCDEANLDWEDKT